MVISAESGQQPMSAMHHESMDLHYLITGHHLMGNTKFSDHFSISLSSVDFPEAYSFLIWRPKNGNMASLWSYKTMLESVGI